eukprot:TRINITY_DN122_c0_g1_i1.p1 TRINITY_DN122_c0_g1~~TRINITY_DN122_c0_g1_i1.p1  ORF type:complete len:611 (+),score=51.89 TRINITY_DN122_c0_g1_i1:1013-2845(+)
MQSQPNSNGKDSSTKQQRLLLCYYTKQFKKNIREITETTTGLTLEHDISNISKDNVSNHHYVYYRKTDSKNIYYEMNWTQINFADAACTAFIIRDETPFVLLGKKKEEENYSKRLVASITHDLRTPLNGILGIADALEEFVFHEGKHFLDLVKNTGTLMLYLINDVLDMVQIEAKKLRLRKSMYSPKDIIEETIQLMTFNFSQKGVELELWFASNIPYEIYSDKARYKQILLNLLGNALKFTSKGSVSVAVFYDAPTDMLITKVQDTGPGILPEDFPKLFQLFSCFSNTEKINPSGVGLGLHICKSLSGQLGGDIFADSRFGYGATFTFYINCGLSDNHGEDRERSVPDVDYIKNVTKKATVNKEEAKDASIFLNNPQNIPSISLNVQPIISSNQEPTISPTHKKHLDKACKCPAVLLVDDNQMNLFVLNSYLKGTNITASVAYNGKEAIEAVLKKAKNKCCKKYDVIYMDINMPIMDGIEAANILTAMANSGEVLEMPIIALSAGASSEYKGEACFKEVMEKPITKEKFIASVSRYCLENQLTSFIHMLLLISTQYRINKIISQLAFCIFGVAQHPDILTKRCTVWLFSLFRCYTQIDDCVRCFSKESY